MGGEQVLESAGGLSSPPAGLEDEPQRVAPAIVVVDGTWNNVKQMVRHFSREIGPDTAHVRLEPTELSVYARTQTRSDGISSVEAVALLLRSLGESDEVCAELVRYITVNNEALKLRQGAKSSAR